MSSHYLNVAIGLAYTFLAVSLLCSATREAIASLFQTRAKVLLDGVLTLLHEPQGRHHVRGILPSLKRLLRVEGGFGLHKLGPQSLSAAVMEHPLVTGLAQRGRMPSYIPSAIFARALVSTLTERYGKPSSADDLLSCTGNVPLQRTLQSLMGDEPNDLAALETAIRIWYETVMDRITGWYKRRSQMVLFCVGLFYACTMNIDALQLTQRLWRDDVAAAQLAQQASVAVASGQAMLEVSALPALPLGWPSPRFEQGGGRGGWTELTFALLGWIITAFAASLGSPFWFDGIGRLLGLRGSGVKPPPVVAAKAGTYTG